MSSTMTGSKIYIEIVKKLREMIEKDGLKPGDRIPSERELSEQLHVGRSSVREALRALELLGLIETRRGEGTFIRDAHGNQLVQLLSTFILQDEKAKRDVKDTKYLIEMDCLRLVIERNNEKQLLHLKRWVETEDFTDDEFFSKMVELSDNHLIYRIWIILSDYYQSLNLQKEKNAKEEYIGLIAALISKEDSSVLSAYRRLRKLSN